MMLFPARINPAIKKRGTTSKISAAVAIKKTDSTEQEVEVSQKTTKLSSIMTKKGRRL